EDDVAEVAEVAERTDDGTGLGGLEVGGGHHLLHGDEDRDEGVLNGGGQAAERRAHVHGSDRRTAPPHGRGSRSVVGYVEKRGRAPAGMRPTAHDDAAPDGRPGAARGPRSSA